MYYEPRNPEADAKFIEAGGLKSWGCYAFLLGVLVLVKQEMLSVRITNMGSREHWPIQVPMRLSLLIKTVVSFVVSLSNLEML